MGIETRLNEVILDELAELKRMKIGSDEYKATVDGVTKMIDRTIEIKRINTESDDKRESAKADNELRVAQMEEDRKSRIIGHILNGLGIVIPAAITIWGTIKSIEFEKEGTITTIMGRGFIQKLLPKK